MSGRCKVGTPFEQPAKSATAAVSHQRGAPRVRQLSSSVGRRVTSPGVPAQPFRGTVEMVQGGHHIWALKGTACAGRGPYVLSAQHAFLGYLAEGTWQNCLYGKNGDKRGAGKGSPCGVGQQAVCGERGQGEGDTFCRGVYRNHRAPDPWGLASRSTTLHLGQNWGRAAVAGLRDVAR